jgi:radical SAM superfamily enzyme YgiQ (UPF0313 family)
MTAKSSFYQELVIDPQPKAAVDLLLVNPPAPDSAPWNGSKTSSGRRSSKNMSWPQVSLAQMAAMLASDYDVAVVDAVARQLSWAEFEAMLREKQAQYYLTPVRPHTVQNDMFGAFLARGLGAKIIAFGTYASLHAHELMDLYPNLDFILRGEPELTLRELVDTLEMAAGRWSEESAESGNWTRLQKIFKATNRDWQPAWQSETELDAQLRQVQGLIWRYKGEILVNSERPLIPDLDDIPLPHHHLLPLNNYRMPPINGPYAFLIPNRSCPIDHEDSIKYGNGSSSVRVRSPENIMAELWLLHDLTIHNVHMVAESFTANRDQVIGLCRMIIEEELPLRWTCNTQADSVDEELLVLMSRAGCWKIFWGLESPNGHGLNGANKDQPDVPVAQVLRWAQRVNIKNWGYFSIGLPGETEDHIKETIAFAKQLPLDMALFHPATPYAGLPFFFDRVENGGCRVTNGLEAVKIDRPAETTNGHLSPEALTYWQKRAFREWSLRPGSIWTMLKGLNTWTRFKNTIDTGLPSLG